MRLKSTTHIITMHRSLRWVARMIHIHKYLWCACKPSSNGVTFTETTSISWKFYFITRSMSSISYSHCMPSLGYYQGTKDTHPTETIVSTNRHISILASRKSWTKWQCQTHLWRSQWCQLQVCAHRICNVVYGSIEFLEFSAFWESPRSKVWLRL